MATKKPNVIPARFKEHSLWENANDRIVRTVNGLRVERWNGDKYVPVSAEQEIIILKQAFLERHKALEHVWMFAKDSIDGLETLD